MTNVSESASLEKVGVRGHKCGLPHKGKQCDSEAGRDSVLLGERDNPTVAEQELQSKSHGSHQKQPQPTELLPACSPTATLSPDSGPHVHTTAELASGKDSQVPGGTGVSNLVHALREVRVG